MDYRTGVFGKWHNGDEPDTPAYRAAFAEAWKDFPRKQPRFGLGVNPHGFEEAWVHYGGGGDFFTRSNLRNLGPASWWHNGELRPSDTGYTEGLIVDHACEFLSQSAGKPFFCYVPFHIVHEPLQAKEDDLAAIDPAITDPAKRAYAAMLHAMDKNVARLLATLDDLGLCENTIVVLSSDNGATLTGSNRPLRGGKHSLYEGGVRVPTVFHWPGGGLGGRTWNGLCSSLDMLPTLAALAGVSPPAGLALDGKDIAASLREGGPSPVESVYWAWHGSDALRTQRWKPHRFSNRVNLYNIEADPAEAVFDALVGEAGVRRLNGRLDLKRGVCKDGPRITAIRLEDGSLVEGRVFIDASYKGDLMAAAGVAFVAGREANAEFKEQGNGIVGLWGWNQLPDGIDPYRTAGKPESGLLPGVNPDMGGRAGAADQRLQAYCYRMVLTDVPANRVPIPKPASYDEADYEILFRAVATDPHARFFKSDLVPHRKTDSNNTGGISCDLIGGNYGSHWNWASLDHAQREAVAARHRDWQLGLVWTLQNHPRIPEAVRQRHVAWGAGERRVSRQRPLAPTPLRAGNPPAAV
ncbi:MAG: sulfatase-like hydrolase/transferase [Pirellulales bacterium]